MNKERKLSVLAGLVIASCLKKEDKDDLLNFIDEIGYPEHKKIEK